MILEEAISTEKIRARLKELRKYLPDKEEITYKFGIYFAYEISDRTTPSEFVDCFESLLLKMMLFEGAIAIETNIPSYFPEIVNAICPRDFANDVLKAYKKSPSLYDVLECCDFWDLDLNLEKDKEKNQTK